MNERAAWLAREKAKKYVQENQKEIMMMFLDKIQEMKFKHKFKLCIKLLFGRKKK